MYNEAQNILNDIQSLDFNTLYRSDLQAFTYTMRKQGQ